MIQPLALLLCASGWAVEPPEPDELLELAPTDEAADPFAEPLEMMHRVADSGYARGGTLLAIVALEEHLGDPRAPLVRLEISRYQRLNGLLLEEERTLIRGLDAHPARWKPWFELALLDAELQRQDFQALTDAHDGRSEWPTEISDAAHFYGAWGRAGTGDEAGARVLLAKVRGGLQPAAQGFAAALQERPARHRSPFVAGLLSVIPGVGHAYAADPTGAAANVLVTGGLGATSVYLYTHEEPLLSAVFGVLSGASLLAGIGDATRQAQSFNRASQVARFEDLAGQWWLRGAVTTDGEHPLDVTLEPLQDVPGRRP